MQHIRWPLIPLKYIKRNLAKQPLLKKIPRSMYFFIINNVFIINLILYSYTYNIIFLVEEYLFEAFRLHTVNNAQLTIPQTIRNTPRMFGQKVSFCFD